MMLAYFLILYGAVGFIQDKRFFGSAPKENLAAIPEKKERFPGVHGIGWLIEAVAILLFAGAAVLSVWDGIRSGFRFWNYFVRFLVMLYCLEIYDILFFDWVLLCHSNFFPHFYPELKGVVGPHMFGYNKKTAHPAFWGLHSRLRCGGMVVYMFILKVQCRAVSAENHCFRWCIP